MDASGQFAHARTHWDTCAAPGPVTPGSEVGATTDALPISLSSESDEVVKKNNVVLGTGISQRYLHGISQ